MLKAKYNLHTDTVFDYHLGVGQEMDCDPSMIGKALYRIMTVDMN